MKDQKELTIIGRAELADFPKLGIKKIPAKIDTGADLSSIDVSFVQETPKGLECILFRPNTPSYNGEKLIFEKGEYTITRVSSSFGNKEYRYRVKLAVKINGRLINATFTLANRGTKLYPVLIGRRLLSGKFIVDVSKGKPLKSQEKARAVKLKQELDALKV